MPVYYHPLYTGGIDASARFPRDRYDLVREGLLRSEAPVEVRPAPPACRAAVAAAHDEGFVDRFLAGTLADKERRRIGLTPWTPLIVDRTMALVGGSLAAMEHALATGGVAGNMAGGTHHAFFDHGTGYCIFNDLAVCATRALQAGVARIAVVDLDVHQGDGTASMFAAEPRVFTVSVHCQANFPFRKQASDLDIGLPKGAGDDAYLDACEAAVEAAMATVPELVLFQSGVDALEADALGHLAVSREGMRQRNDLVFRATRGVPLAVLMGGGYAKPIERTVEAFVDLFEDASYEHAARIR